MMDKEYWAGPVWSSRSFYKDKASQLDFCYPDSENVGFGTVTEHRSADWSSTTPGSTFTFTRSKDIEAKFPLNKTLPYAYPLLRPRKSLSKETKCKVEPISGNCLDTMLLGGKYYVVHPVQKANKPLRITASRLMPGDSDGKDELQKGSHHHKLKREVYFPTENSVQQLVCQEFLSNGFILHRSNKEVQLIRLQETNEGFNNTSCTILSSSMTTDTTLSHVFPGIWSLACANGSLQLYDASSRTPLWKAKFSESNSKSVSHVYQCDFSDHPCSLLVGTDSNIWVCDTRKPYSASKKDDNSADQTVFSVSEVKKSLLNCENICSFQQVYGSSFLYVVTNDSVYVVDQRNDSMPVLQWRHMLLDQPSFITSHRIDNLEFAMVANSCNHKVCVMANKWISDVYGKRCQGVSLPKHFLTEQDTVEFAHRQDLWFSHQVMDRLASRWTGVATFTHQASPSALSFLSLYANGDIFCQDLHLSQDNSNTLIDKPLTDTQQAKTLLSQWEEKAVAEICNLPENNYIYYNASPFFPHNCNNTSQEIEAITTNLPQKSKCGSMKINDRKVKDINENGSVNIWNVSEDAQNLRKKTKKTKGCKRKSDMNNEMESLKWLKHLVENCKSEDKLPDIPDEGSFDAITQYLPCELATLLKVESLKKKKDPLSSQLLSLWLGDTSAADEEATCDSFSSSVAGAFTYNTAPFNIKHLSFLPSKLHGGQAQQYLPPNSTEDTTDMQHSLVTPHLPDTEYQVPDLDLNDLFVSSYVPSQASQASNQASQVPGQGSQVSSKKVKTPGKKLKKKRLDGF